MAYTTNKLISDAYYASGIVSREFETVSGNESNNALLWLNELIGKKVVQKNMIPYESETTFTSVIGQENYEIPNLISIDTLTFIKDSVRYPMNFIPRNQYKGNSRVETINSLPYQYFYERKLGGANIYLYFIPDKPYVFTINGIFRLSDLSLGQDLESILDKFYISYLKYELADKICHEYSMPVPSGVMRELSEYEALISKQSRPMDLSIRKKSTLQQRRKGGWAYVNLGEGYIP